MKSVYRFIFCHRGLCKAGLFLGLVAFTVRVMRFESVSFLSIYLMDLALWFLGTRFIAMAPEKLLKEPSQIMNEQCDPYPFLEETRCQLECNQPGLQHQSTQVNYAMALHSIGETSKSAEILENINIDRYPGSSPYFKFVYYNNLSDVLFELERTFEAQIWHRKSLQIFNDLPENKLKQQLSEVVQLGQVEALYRDKDYDKALRKVAWINCKSQRQLLNAALLAAKCHIALREPDKAREKLQYVAEHGNKLHIVEEAAALLKTLA